MYHESESEFEKLSLDKDTKDKDKSTALTTFLRSIDQSFMDEMKQYLEKNICDKKHDQRKISLYEDIQLIYTIKSKLDDSQLSNVRYRSERVKEEINNIRNGRSLPTLLERINKILCKLTPDIIRTHMKAKVDFNFKGKNYVPFNYVNGGPSKNKNVFDQSKAKKEQRPRPIEYNLKRQEKEVPCHKMSVSIKNKEDGKSSIESKYEKVSIDTQCNGKNSPLKQCISNELVDRIICVYNPKTKNLHFTKIQEKKQIIFQENEQQISSKRVSTQKQGEQVDNQDNLNSKSIQIIQDKYSAEELSSKFAQTRQKMKQNEQALNYLLSQQKPNNSNIKNKEAKTQVDLKDSQQLFNNLQYELSNNEQHLKLVLSNPDLRTKLAFSKDEDENLIKFNLNPHERDNRLFVYCLLKYKSLDQINDRLRFLNIDINDAIYPAIKEIEAKQFQVPIQ